MSIIIDYALLSRNMFMLMGVPNFYYSHTDTNCSRYSDTHAHLGAPTHTNSRRSLSAVFVLFCFWTLVRWQLSTVGVRQVE